MGEAYQGKHRRVEEFKEGRIVIQQRVAVTPELVSWIRYYGSKIGALESASL